MIIFTFLKFCQSCIQSSKVLAVSVIMDSESLLSTWLSQKYWTWQCASVCGTKYCTIYTCISGITIIFIPDKVPKYRTVRLSTGHLATLLLSFDKITYYQTCYQDI